MRRGTVWRAQPAPRGCGRTDFQQGSAQTLYRSIKEQIFVLPSLFILIALSWIYINQHPGDAHYLAITTLALLTNRLSGSIPASRSAARELCSARLRRRTRCCDTSTQSWSGT